ncbi:MAG: TrkH family potassium uptake protein [Spirochaetales bacterium]|nr:TrkH family potassium uptake protein [Spirochaetales bacterium]
MNLKQVFSVVSILLFIIALFMLFPVVFALIYEEWPALKAFLLTQGTILILAAIVRGICRNHEDDRISTRDGFFLVSLAWLLAGIFGALPFFLSGAIPSFADAFFESASGFTTTGASILTNIEGLPKSILFWRSLTHWLGGMGIVVLTVAVLPFLGIGGIQILKAEAPGPTLDKLTPKIATTAKALWFIYLGLTILEILLLCLGGMNLFDSMTHTFGTMATGGFSPKNTSVAFYRSPFIDTVITVFMLLAGMNFLLYFRLLTGKIRDVLRNTEIKAYLGIFFAATLGITWALMKNGSYSGFRECFRYAGFQAASILTTTGFVTADYELWPAFAQILLFVLMFIGGCAGSTGGGMKVIRLVTLFKQGINEMKYLAFPRGVFTFHIDGRAVRKTYVYNVMGFVFLYLVLLLLATMVTAFSGEDIATSLSTALVTLGNIGPGFGSVGPTKNYADYPAYLKWFLSFIMITGRLEVYTVLILFTPRFWKR